ncbi:amidohydrolase family protein [Aquimarina sp. ERC-38]|uniref:amidohydrolase family protein n=1 Tax=Aquimarina sp. ERC-38 TaxID=2949996 RepID=UPI00224858C2|nr:amidohydrolase family protein [Aquimarina sp. ERC-38]UZO80871.1 amidohydrolase family protein [Aquimarina sp. ERC-38]
MKKILPVLLATVCAFTTFSQEYFPKNDGIKTTNTNYTALTNATIHISPEETLTNGTLLFQKGKIVAVGKKVELPENTLVIDSKDKHIYASFIDLFTDFGIKKPEKKADNPFSGQPQYGPGREGHYWNDHIRPETNALASFTYDKKKAEEFIKQGFGTVQAHMPDGIARGTGLLVTLQDQVTNGERLLSDASAQFFSFEKSAKSKQSYPTSLMGAMALLRQMYLDANWYAGGQSDNKDISLEALIRNKNLPQIFDAGSRINSVRADKVGDYANVQYILLGGGDEFERITNVKNTAGSYIIPVNFPEAYDLSDPLNNDLVSLAKMKQWNQAPTNPGVLQKNGVPFAVTTHKLKKLSNFHTKIKKAIQYGWNKKDALASLTTVPALLLNKSNELGTLKTGAYANFLVTDKEIFEEDMVLFENWIQGHKNIITDRNLIDITGKYSLKTDAETYNLEVTGTRIKPTVKVTQDSTKINSKLVYKNNRISLLLTGKDTTQTSFIRFTGLVDKNSKNWNGEAIMPDGSSSSFTAIKTGEVEKKKATPTKENYEVVPVTYPNMAYGVEKLPQKETLLFKNATLWTNETEGVLEETDILIKDGKIAKIGKNLNINGASVVDATGKHITPGIIDEHSHIAAAAINEAGHNSSAEVTIEDVVTPDDIEIYRNIAGGVTSIQILHGSANPIGGRSAIIKLKWGEDVDQLIYKDTPKFIKFALGENVKQSNWGGRSRFPQSRMGVEQLYIDYFTRARAYDQKKKSGAVYRKDIELETLAEILNKERFISCHSYIQSEINMLMKVADQFGFTVNTFTHILEGYKVADKMAKHGAGGSTFSDWWAYKYEVNDAIPYNAAMMHNQGVTVAINSDDAEMSRRLNQEAAKSVKYGNMSEEDALKFVTLNPAKLLHIDDRVGSLKVGKDADIVLWTTHPLSIYTKAEKTIIDGTVYFDLEKDKRLRQQMTKEKNKLSAMMLKEKNKGMATKKPAKKSKEHLHCDSLQSGL